MSDNPRRWYTEPETFIAAAALIVSISAVAVGLYEASLQRDHDKAEVWPHLELSTYMSPQGAALHLVNTGIGPAIVHSIVVTVDGRPQRNWDEALLALLGKRPTAIANSTVAEHALRAGDDVSLVGIRSSDLPPGFWQYVKRVGVRVCYGSVFGESWTLTSQQLGTSSTWASVPSCPTQPAGEDF